MTVKDTFNSFISSLTKGFAEGEEVIEDKTPQTILPYEGTLALDTEMKNTPKNTPAVESKVVTHTAFNKSNTEVIICEPRKYSESVDFVRYLKEKKTIIVNISLLDSAEALRLVDFLCGAAHALSGNMNKISDNVYIFTPMNVSLSAESQNNKMVKDAFWE